MSLVLGISLPPRAAFSQHGCVLYTRHETMSEQTLKMRGPPKRTLEDAWGGGSQPWHSLTHIIFIYIEYGSGALNDVRALSCRGLHHTSLLPGCFSNVDSGDVYTCRPLVQGELISSLF